MLLNSLLILFAPPVFFLIRKRWGAFVINAILSFMGAVTIMFFGIGLFFWFIASFHAAWTYRVEMMERHADQIAGKVAARMKAGV